MYHALPAPLPCLLQPQDVYNDHDGSPQLCLRRQVARLLSLLALHPAARKELCSAASVWPAWLRDAAVTSDCRLASQATKALLHLEQRGGRWATGGEGGEEGGKGEGGGAY